MGVMLTASHNDESYNGVKVAAPDGSMLDADQEQILIQWVNERDIQQWKTLLQDFIDQPSTTPSLGSWHVGRDTRSHSQGFSDLVIQAATFMGVSVIDHGILTTPMLHQIVLMSNQQPEGSTTSSSRPANRQTYLEQLAQAYCTLDQLLLTTTTTTTTTSTTTTTNMDTLQVDGACGVGYPAMVDLVAALHTINPLYAKRFQPRNPPGSGPLNEQCGSEHVQKQLMPPQWYDEKNNDNNNSPTTTTTTAYACSVDGDADRIVFWSTSSTTDSDVSLPGWTLLDGDKIAVLMGQFFQQLQLNGDLPSDLAIGVVQTAYANGASTQYLKVGERTSLSPE
jgi:phosphoacetylglucosamine mutase